jgi:hypothetical protein
MADRTDPGERHRLRKCGMSSHLESTQNPDVYIVQIWANKLICKWVTVIAYIGVCLYVCILLLCQSI